MSSGIDALNVIASDIGVRRFSLEKASLSRRVSYSASRFWLQAFCMDDGECGKKGITKQAMNRRLKSGYALDRICPGIDTWFDSDGKGIRAVYNRLIDVGDLTLNSFEESYVATPLRMINLSESLSCVSGYFDPTAKRTEKLSRL